MVNEKIARFEKVVKQNKATKEYYKKLEKVTADYAAYQAKKEQAKGQVEALEEELADLDFKYIASLDNAEMQAVNEQRKAKRQELDDARAMANFSVEPQIHRIYNALGEEAKAFREEADEANKAAREAKAEIDEEAKARKAAIDKAMMDQGPEKTNMMQREVLSLFSGKI